jgi:hypothetical protein
MVDDDSEEEEDVDGGMLRLLGGLRLLTPPGGRLAADAPRGGTVQMTSNNSSARGFRLQFLCSVMVDIFLVLDSTMMMFIVMCVVVFS